MLSKKKIRISEESVHFFLSDLINQEPGLVWGVGGRGAHRKTLMPSKSSVWWEETNNNDDDQ